MMFFFALALTGLGALQLYSTEALAQSSYFAGRGCTDCHSAPTAATCAGCHQHSGTLTATKNKTTSYAPSETVTITLTASGARSGWIGARLYDQTGAEIARSTGSQSGMGGSTIYPAVISAPAPATAGTYTWRMAYFGNENGTGTGDVHSEKSVNVSITVAAPGDTAVPVVGAFTIPAGSTSLTVPVSSLTATDNVGVTGYLVTTSATAPLSSAAGWTATAPASLTAPGAGSVTFFAWARDAAGNVSASRSAVVSITLPDITVPVVGAFTLPASATNLTVIVSAFTATDNVGVTGYLITTSATAPAASASGWTSAAPASVAAPSAGPVIFYAWARDASGNVSASKSATVNITLPDTTAPVVTAFTIPATATTLTVSVNAFTATDNVGVTGYMVTTSGVVLAASASGWTSAPPVTVTASAEGNVTFYSWARDASGNVSLSRSASIVITTATETDTTKPALSVSALADGASTNKPTLNVTGTATDAGGLDSLTVNGQNVPVNADGSFSTALNLVSGANTVTVIATDKAGNQESNSRSINYDASVPVLTVADPADNSTSVQSFLTVSGTINETSTVSVKVNSGSPQSASISGNSFSATVNLASGVNTIEITATDLAGNTSSAKRTVTYDGGNFTLAVTYPNQDITTSKSSLVLTGKIVDATSKVRVTITVDGRKYTPRVAYGVFRQRLTFTRAKLYAITVKATDEAGNSSSVIRNVIYRNSDDDERDDDRDDDD